MPEAAIAERSTVAHLFLDGDINYSQLNPAIHKAIDLITLQTGGCLMRVDGVNEEGIDLMRSVLKAAEGSRLPHFYYRPDKGYVQGGYTAPIEARHSEFEVQKVWQHKGLEVTSAWLKLPAYSARQLAEAQEAQNYQTEEQDAYRPSKKLLVTVAAAGVVEYGSLIEGVSSGSKLALGAFAASLTVAAAGIVRMVSKS